MAISTIYRRVPNVPYWKTSPVITEQTNEWTPTINQVWDISSDLIAASVPSNPTTIFLAWGASQISNVMWFDFLDAADVVLDSTSLFGDFQDLNYGIDRPIIGSMINIPGGTKKLKYISTGGETHDYTNKYRFISIFGWQQ